MSKDLTTSDTLVGLPGTTRRAVRGTASVRCDQATGLFVTSAVTDRGHREDLDSAGDCFLAWGLRDHINEAATP
jgi:hypothetical protein